MKLTHHFHVLCNRNSDGSYATQANRRNGLQLIAKELKALGYNQIHNAHSLKPKHTSALVQYWITEQRSVGTIKNRMAHLRWVAEKTNRPDLIAKNNAFYGIENRAFVGINKALDFTDNAIYSIKDKQVQASAMLQREFGLRREEALKIVPEKADRGDRLVLEKSWCKGGRAREIPITTQRQRLALNQAKHIADHRSLIPANLKFINQIRVFEREMSAVGLGRSHGARHAFAQERYHAISGWQPPNKGGPKYKHMSDAEKRIDRHARQQISRELGHERIEITAVYLGS